VSGDNVLTPPKAVNSTRVIGLKNVAVGGD
jgi:hypothetical protein